MSLTFRIVGKDGNARAGLLGSAHGEVPTPAFMPVGTRASVKGMTAEALRECGARIVLANAYHLMLRPGAERVADLGGLHALMGWPGPILTDSGGFQLMSLGKLCVIREDGALFRSHLDGSLQNLTPERTVQVQYLLDATISMVLDQCIAFPAPEEAARSAMERSMRWARRSRDAYRERPGYGLFGIVQGGVFPALRAESVAALTAIGFDGYAIGGLAVGEGQARMLAVLETTLAALPPESPRYLMGVGTPSDLVESIRRGVDLFDCVMPTRAGRTGRAFTTQGVCNIRNARFAADRRPLDARCDCPLCRGYSRGYLHHLFKAGEMLGAVLLTWHNLRYYERLMEGCREAIVSGTLEAYAARRGVEMGRMQ